MPMLRRRRRLGRYLGPGGASWMGGSTPDMTLLIVALLALGGARLLKRGL